MNKKDKKTITSINNITFFKYINTQFILPKLIFFKKNQFIKSYTYINKYKYTFYHLIINYNSQ